MPAILLLAALFVGPLVPQDTKATARLEPAHFFLPDCECMVFADLKQLREREIWEELQATAIGMALPKLEREGGFPLADLDRVWIQAELPVADGKAGPRQILIFEGNTGLGLPESISRDSWYRKDTIGDCPVYARTIGSREDLVATPRPELRIEGSRGLIEPVLLGKPWNGKPSADAQSLLSGRGDNVLYLIVGISDATMRGQLLGRLLGEVTWPEDDGPTHVMARVRVVGAKDDPHLEVEVLLRHRLGKAGMDVSEAAARQWFASLQTHPRLGALKSLWKSIELRREGPDLVARKDLGRSRDPVGTLALMLSPIVQR